MILNKEVNYRFFHPQTNLYFKFDLSNYDSQDFEVGLSGEGSLFFSFQSGFIKSPDSKIIGSFNKERQVLDGYVRIDGGVGSLYYSLNGTPIDRNVTINNLTNLYSVAVKIKDAVLYSSPGVIRQVELDYEILGANTPTLILSDLEISPLGLSGRISLDNNSSFFTRIYSGTSQDVAGTWIFPDRIYPGNSYVFYNSDVKLLNGGTKVALNLETDAGFQNYDLDLINNSTDGGVVPLPDRQNEESQYIQVSSYSGDIAENQQSEEIFSIRYAIGESHKLNFTFDYNQGKNGSLSTTKQLPNGTPIILSGKLPATNGICNGYLFNSNFTTTDTYVISDPSSSIYPSNGFTNYAIEEEISGYFENLNPTGYASIIKNIIPSLSQINDLELYPSIAIDLGGTSGTISAGVSSPATRVYSLINEYNEQSISVGNTSETFSGFVGENDAGKFNFTNGIFFRSGVILETQSTFDSILTQDYLYPYRGIGMASLNQSVILTADAGQDGKKYWTIIDKSNPLFIFKNLNPLIIQSGSYKVTAGTLISGFLLRENDSFYYGAAGGPWNTENNTSSVSFVNETSRNFCNRLINRFASFYATLNPFKYLNPSMGIYKSLKVNSNKEKIGDINLNDTNFLMNPFKNININNKIVEVKNLIYKSTFPHLCYTFDDPIFLYSEYVNNGTQDSSDNISTNLFPDFVPYADDYNITSPIPFAYQNAIVSQIYNKISRILRYEITNVDGKNALIYIPFQAGKLSLPKTFVFSFEIKNPTGGANELQKIQVAFSDGMWFQTFEDKSVIEKKSYTNFDLNTKESHSVNPLGNYISTTATPDGYIKIAVNLFCTHPQDISYIILNFINGNITDVGRLEGFSSGGLLSTEIRRLQVYEGSIPIDNQLPSYTARQGTFSPIDFECIFSYFMHKICGVGGFFDRPTNYKDESNIAYFRGKNMARFNPTTKVQDITTDSKNKITHLFGESLDANSENIAQKIFKFIYFVLTGLNLSSTKEAVRRYKYGSKIFAAQRKSLALFSIATDFVNLYTEDDNQIKTYTSTDLVHGEAVSKILEIIKKYNPEFNTRYRVQDNTIIQIPQLLKSAEIELAPDIDIYAKRFYVILPRDLRLYIPLGKGRYYLNNSNTSQNTYGFFYQTDGYLKNQTQLNDAGDFVDIFPLDHEKLNSYAISQNKQQIDSDTIFKRLIYSQGWIELYKEINEPVYLTEGYFEKEKLTDANFTVTVTGKLLDVTKRTVKVWDIEFADDDEMSINKIDIVNEKVLKVYNRGGIKFVDNDNSIYSLDDIAPLKDNKLYTKFLKIKYLNPPEKIIESSDACSISFILKSGDLNETVSINTINIP